jgi:molecular chaperone GrpE
MHPKDSSKPAQPVEFEPHPGATGEAESEGGAESGDEKSLAGLVAKLQAEKQELLDSLVRRQADFENYRKRVERDRHHESRRGVAALVEGLLPVLDAFERALAAHDDPAYEDYRKGFQLIYRQLVDALTKHGLQRIETRGKAFDPHFHYAIERVESNDHPDGTVLEEFQAGYLFHDKVLRAAMVRVAIHPADAELEGTV